MAKKVTLQDAKNNNLFPTTTIDQVKADTAGTALFEFDSSTNILTLKSGTLDAALSSTATAAVDMVNLTQTVKNAMNVNKIAGAATEAVIFAKTSDTGIWVGTDTNKWYYWSGTAYPNGAYVEGGDFVSTADQKVVIVQDSEPTGTDKTLNKIWINESGEDEIEVYTTDEVDEKYSETTSNYLYAKKVMAIGDSMVAGHSLESAKTWLAKFANRNSMIADNRGTNGAYMTNKQYGSVDNSVYQKLCVPTSALYISDADLSTVNYFLVYAGTNDCAAQITIGEINSTDPTEFCGALNLICQTLQTRIPKAKIGFITPYLRSGIEERCQTYVNAIKTVCAKYSIPVFDNAANGAICWSNSAIVSALTLNDTYHLNEEGMEYVSYKYEQFLREM